MSQLVLQCLECQLCKLDGGKWGPVSLNPLQDRVSHTYCPDCLNRLKEQLTVVKDFRDWNFPGQVQYLKKVLKHSPKKYDAVRLKHLLKDFYDVPETDIPRYIFSLEGYLCEMVCAYCLDEIPSRDTVFLLGSCRMHGHCFGELSDKMDLVLKNKWEHSHHLDAYLDMLNIQKEIRPTLKQQLETESRE